MNQSVENLKVRLGDRVSVLDVQTSEEQLIGIIDSVDRIKPFTIIDGYFYISSETRLAKFLLGHPVGYENEVTLHPEEKPARLRITKVFPKPRLE